MSSELVQIGQDALAQGGAGFGSSLFNVKPSTITVTQKMTRAEGAIPGKLRVSDTGEHFDQMQVVMLRTPTPVRDYFEGDGFSKESKICFSTNGLEPHARAKVPQAMKCGFFDTRGNFVPVCPKASWENYRKTKARADLPPCKDGWFVILADRVTQLPYYLNVKKTNIEPFKNAMSQVAKLAALMKANALAHNKALAASNPEVAEAVGAGKWHPLLKPMPSIYDVSFKMFVVEIKDVKGVYYNLGFKDFAPLKEEDRASFGALFLDYANRNAQSVADAAADNDGEEPAVAAGANTASEPALPATDATPAPIEGEIVI